MECDFKSTQLVIQFAMCNVVAQYMYSLTLIGIVKVIWVALDIPNGVFKSWISL